MTESDLDRDVSGQRTIAPSVVVWNTVVPAMGLALILGASVLPVFAIAGVASMAISVVLAPPARRLRWRSWMSVHVARHRVLPGG